MAFDYKFKIKLPEITQSAYDALEKAKREIVQRTLQGKNINGRAFPAYTDKYAAWKSGFTPSGKPRKTAVKSGKRAGFMRKVRPVFGCVGTPNLSLSGRML